MPSISSTLKTIAFAHDYHKYINHANHIDTAGQRHGFFINNLQIAPYLQKDLTLKSFSELFQLCQNQGVFNLQFYHHIPCVTFNAAAKHMTRKWPRDHCGMIPLIEDKYPHELWPGLCQWAKAYNQPCEIHAFERVLKKPSGACHNQGVSHTFWQNTDGTLRRDSRWKMRQRIESHGELLRNLAKYSAQHLQNESKLPDDIIKTIVRFTHYLYIQSTSPQSCGPWEEIPFPNGINWDNLSVVNAFNEVLLLIKKLPQHPAVYTAMTDFESQLCHKFTLPLLFSTPSNLQKFIKSSLKQIRHFYLDEFHGATRRIDSSSVMLAAEELDLSSSQDLVVNIRKHLRILKNFEDKLVHEFGAWRYNQFSSFVDGQPVKSCDSYLNLNYYLLCDKKGHLCPNKQDLDKEEKSKIDDNGVRHFKRRALSASEKTSAQWGLPLSYAAIAYGRLTSVLLDAKKKDTSWSEQKEKLLTFCFNKNQEFIKRTYANISGYYPDQTLFLKADGKTIRPWQKPEAYQAVTAKLDTTEFFFIPGVNDHLGWDAAKCYEASKIFLHNLQEINS